MIYVASAAYRPLVVECLFEGSSLPSDFMELLDAKAKERAASAGITIGILLDIGGRWDPLRNRWFVRAFFKVIEEQS
jgi:hypothetical protein